MCFHIPFRVAALRGVSTTRRDSCLPTDTKGSNVFHKEYKLNDVKRKLRINMKHPSTVLAAVVEYEKWRGESENVPDLALLTLAMEMYNKVGKPHVTERLWQGIFSFS